MLITLKNDRLTVEIDDLGAQLCSVRNAAGTEYIWQADPAVWARHAPLLFPIIGRLREGQYTLDGETYTISNHGFARDSRFAVTERSGESVSFWLTDSAQTRAVYPFAFALTVTYTLEGNRLTKSCRVENHSGGDMYYELGGHDGFRAPLEPGEAMDDYSVRLPGLEALAPYGMDERGIVTPKTAVYPLEGSRIPLKPSVYGLDTVILDDLPQRRAILADGAGRARVTLDFPDFPYLGIWTPDKPFDTNYVCIEPWTTLPDAVFTGRALSDKPGVRRLAPGGQETLAYTTTFD